MPNQQKANRTTATRLLVVALVALAAVSWGLMLLRSLGAVPDWVGGLGFGVSVLSVFLLVTHTVGGIAGTDKGAREPQRHDTRRRE